MFSQILIVLAASFALFQTFKSENTFAKVLNGLFTLSLGLSFASNVALIQMGFYIFGLLCIFVVIYANNTDNFSTEKKIILTTAGIIQLLGPAFIFLQLPFEYYKFTSFASLFTLSALTLGLSRNFKAYKNEIGFVVVLMVDAFLRLYWLVNHTITT